MEVYPQLCSRCKFSISTAELCKLKLKVTGLNQICVRADNKGKASYHRLHVVSTQRKLMGNPKRIVLKKLELKPRIENSEIWLTSCVETCNGHKKNPVGD